MNRFLFKNNFSVNFYNPTEELNLYPLNDVSEITKDSCCLISFNHNDSKFHLGDMFYFNDSFFIFSFFKTEESKNPIYFGFFKLSMKKKDDISIINFKDYSSFNSFFSLEKEFFDNIYYVGNVFIHDVNRQLKHYTDEKIIINVNNFHTFKYNDSSDLTFLEFNRFMINVEYQDGNCFLLKYMIRSNEINLFYLQTRFKQFNKNNIFITFSLSSHVVLYNIDSVPYKIYYMDNDYVLNYLYTMKKEKDYYDDSRKHKEEIKKYSHKKQILLYNFFFVINENNEFCYLDGDTGNLYLMKDYNLILPSSDYEKINPSLESYTNYILKIL